MTDEANLETATETAATDAVTVTEDAANDIKTETPDIITHIESFGDIAIEDVKIAIEWLAAKL